MKIEFTKTTKNGYSKMIIEAESAFSESAGTVRIHCALGDAVVKGTLGVSESGIIVNFFKIIYDEGIGIGIL